MIFVTPTYKVLDPTHYEDGIKKLQRIESAARISHRSEERQTKDSWEKFVTAVVIGHGDWSVTEHATATVEFHVNRGVTHEMVRHRLFGFTQESTRFVNYSKPGYEASYIPSVAVKPEHLEEWKRDLTKIDETYRKWLKVGYTPQIARDFLPNALGAKIAVTGNLRNWRHAFLMRTSKETHPDFREVMIPLLEFFQTMVPVLYSDIVPMTRQIENLRKPR